MKVENRNAEDDMMLDLHSDNPENFSQLYDKFSPALFGVIIKSIGDHAIAEVMLQDIFLKAWQRRNLYDKTKGRLFTWFYGITQTTCTNYLNSRKH